MLDNIITVMYIFTRGKTVCELWNRAFRGDEMFSVIEKELAKGYPRISFVGYEVFGYTHGPDEREVLAVLPDKLKQNMCEAVISGVGVEGAARLRLHGQALRLRN